VSVRRSGVNWADLADSDEEDGPISYTWSTISTATSSPAGLSRPADQDQKAEKADEIETLGETFNSSQGLAIGGNYKFASSQKVTVGGGPCGQPHGVVYSKATGNSAMRWVDLVESDVDPVDYEWSLDASVLLEASLAHAACQCIPTEVQLTGDSPVTEPKASGSGRMDSPSSSPKFGHTVATDKDLESSYFHACVAGPLADAGVMEIDLGSSKESQAGAHGELAAVMSQREAPTLLVNQRRYLKHCVKV